MRTKVWLGLHLSGINAEKSALAALELKNNIPTVANIFERIGPKGLQTSDDRIFEIFERLSPEDCVFVDSPLGVPPCIKCSREACPGAMRCNDVGVAYLSAISQELGKRRRPVSPQSFRVWDALQLKSKILVEPSYNSNSGPLVYRAKILEKRLRSIRPSYFLRETQIDLAVSRIRSFLKLPDHTPKAYRSFEGGALVRESILQAMVERKVLSLNPQDLERSVRGVEVFQALIAGWVNVKSVLGQIEGPPSNYLPDDSWVWLPVL
jgi:hypothetical protein